MSKLKSRYDQFCPVKGCERIIHIRQEMCAFCLPHVDPDLLYRLNEARQRIRWSTNGAAAKEYTRLRRQALNQAAKARRLS